MPVTLKLTLVVIYTLPFVTDEPCCFPRLSGVGPALLHLRSRLQVVEHGLFVKHCKVEVYLLELKLCENSDPTNVLSCHFSKADTIGESPGWHSRKLVSVQGMVANEWAVGAPSLDLLPR